MESSGSGAADCSVGSIVWVRRRNGSWWPGKILGPEELSASHLMSPRSGTPVKLLGREDASVDWYNLEKSKRVKAFRCGEFDDCIERAESSQGMPIKKREKYARREDAILHALELEKQLLNKQGKSGATSDRMCSKSPGALKKAPVTTSSGSLGNDKGKFGNPRSHQLSKNIDTVSKGEIVASPLFLQKVKEENQLSWEDDNSEATPRMRGLQDFGLRIAPSKRKLVSSVALNGFERPAIENTSQALSTHGLTMETASHGNGKNSLHKGKRSHEGLAVDILVKRRDRRRPIVQVLQNSAKLEVSHSLLPDCGTVSTSISGVEQVGSVSRAKRSKCVYLPTESSDSLEYKEIPASHVDMPSSQFGEGSCHPRLGSFLEENQSGFINDARSDSSDTDSPNSDSDDSSETEPDMDEEEMAALSDPYAHGRPEVLGDYGNLSSEELDESAHSGDTSHRHSEDPVPANEAVSKWKSKGKRNVRNLSRRTTGPSLRQNLSFLRNDDFDYGTEDADWNEKDGWDQMAPLGSGGYPLSSRYSSKNHNRNMTFWEDSAWEDQTTLGRYWENKRDYFDPVYVGSHHVGGRARSYLVDVDLKVQASYQKEPVPIVSLMSKLNGKAIIGHPIQIETLEDGLTETLLSTVSDIGNEALNDGNTAIPPAWRTARRTANFRIPRPHLSSSALDGDEATKDLDLPFSDQEKKQPLKRGSSSSKSRKNVPHIRRPPTDRKLQNKLPKSSLSSSQKTRTLSSFAMEHKYSSKPIHDSSSTPVPVPVPTTTVACIPVKLVFSRLLEKINRPPSKTVVMWLCRITIHRESNIGYMYIYIYNIYGNNNLVLPTQQLLVTSFLLSRLFRRCRYRGRKLFFICWKQGHQSKVLL